MGPVSRASATSLVAVTHYAMWIRVTRPMRAVFSSFLSPSPPIILSSLPKSALPLRYTTPTLTPMVQSVWISFETNGRLRWQSQRVGNLLYWCLLWWWSLISISLAVHMLDVDGPQSWWSFGAGHCASVQDGSFSLWIHGKGVDEEVSSTVSTSIPELKLTFICSDMLCRGLDPIFTPSVWGV